MTTVITINSLLRIDNTTNLANNPSPFDFVINQNTTNGWVMARRPFSRNTTVLTKVNDSFNIGVCMVMIPKVFMPTQAGFLQLQMGHNLGAVVGRNIGSNITNPNVYSLGITGLTGSVCCNGLTGIIRVPIPSPGLNNFNDVFPLYPAENPSSATHWMYESCGNIAMNQDWRNSNVYVRLLDAAGYVVLPSGFTSGDLCIFDKCTVSGFYAPLFEPINSQLIIVLRAQYVENDSVGLEECF